MSDSLDGSVASPFEMVTRSHEFTKTFQSRKTKVADDVYLHYVVGGSGPPVVLIHGFPQTWYMWRKIMLPLAQQHTVIVPDLRGCGDSDKIVGPFDAWTLAGDIRALLEQLDVAESVWVIGHDMGAPVALSYAARYQPQTRGLVYMDEPVFGVNLEHLARFGADNASPLWWWPFQHQPLLAELLLVGHEREYFDFFVFSKTHVANHWAMGEEDKEEYVRHLREAGGLTGALGGYRDVFKTEAHLESLKTTKLTIPTLGMNGEFGLPTAAVAGGLVGYAENVEDAVILGSGHFIAEERPDDLLRELRGFISKNSSEAPVLT